jgi:integrase
MTPDSTTKPRLKGFGYVYRRGTIYWIRYSVRGQDYRESSGSNRESDAFKLLKQRWQEVGRGRFIGPSQYRVMMDDLFASLENEYIANGYRSFRSLKGQLAQLRTVFAGRRAVDVDERQIEKYKTMRLAMRTQRGDKPIRPATVNRELAALRRGFALAVRRKLLAAAPTIDLLRENNVREGFVEPSTFEKVAAALPDHLQDFVRFAYLSGWRRGEIRDLDWSKVSRDSKTVFLGRSKNGEPRILPLVGELDKIIERRWQARTVQNEDGSTLLATYVFHCGDGRAIGDFRKSWRSACKKAAVPELLLHDLRRSAVRNFDNNGVSQIVGMMISGHRTASIYKRYRIVPENDIRQALEKVEQANQKQREAQSVVTINSAGAKK